MVWVWRRKAKTRKLAFIIVRLVEEADEQRDEDLERELSRELEKTRVIPWCEKIEKVVVLEGEVVGEDDRERRGRR